MAKKSPAQGLEAKLGVMTPSGEQLSVLTKLVNEALTLTASIAATEEMLARQKAALRVITVDQLPDLITASGAKDFTTIKGVKVDVKDMISASLPKDPAKRDAALKWLTAHDGAGLIKQEISLSFGKGQLPMADKLQKLLIKNGYTEFSAETGVHPQTLAAFIREGVKTGQRLPLETLGAYLWTEAKIKVPKGDT